MVTNMAVSTVASYGSEDRSWLIGEHGANMPINVVLDFTLFTGDNFASGLVKSGTILGKTTTGGKYGPYDPSDTTTGRGVAAGILFNSFKIPTDTATVASDAALVHCHVKVARLPYTTGLGAVDADARTDLKLVYFN